MKRYIGVAALVVAAVVGGVLFFGMRQQAEAPIVACTADAQLCPDGSYVGRTGPNCSFAPCPEIIPEESDTDDMIIIDSPREGAVLTSPFSVSGKARGNWFFEASAPVVVVDWDGKIIGEGFVTAQGNWMTTEFVPFTGMIRYTADPNTPYSRGTIIFKKDNPSGLPEHDAAKEISVTFEELTKPGTAATDPGLGEPVFCTMDAKLCPDGSYVGRVGPSCAFAPCPGPSGPTSQ